jgi:uncharacterized Zn finger protein
MRQARLWTRIRKRRATRRARNAPLHVCVGCGEAFVQPVRWSESGPWSWWLLLRCGSCGTWHEAFATNAAVEAYDRFLERAIASIERAAERLNRERLVAQGDAFAEALRLDLIGADDFA